VGESSPVSITGGLDRHEGLLLFPWSGGILFSPHHLNKAMVTAKCIPEGATIIRFFLMPQDDCEELHPLTTISACRETALKSSRTRLG